MRAVGLGACSGMARIGAIVTPFVAQVSIFLLTDRKIQCFNLGKKSYPGMTVS